MSSYLNGNCYKGVFNLAMKVIDKISEAEKGIGNKISDAEKGISENLLEMSNMLTRMEGMLTRIEELLKKR